METKTFLAFSCVHVPFESASATSWLLDAIKKRRPDVVVCLGDLFDNSPASRWPSEHTHDMAEEYQKANLLLERIRKITPDSHHQWLAGNHEDNGLAPNRFNRRYRDLLDYRLREHIPEYSEWGNTPYRNAPSGLYRLGQVTFCHGYECGATSDVRQAVKCCASRPYSLFVCGHTHQPRPVTQCELSNIRLPIWCANPGTLASLDPPLDYVYRRDTRKWGAGIVVGETALTKSERQGIMWEAEVLIHRMAWDV